MIEKLILDLQNQGAGDWFVLITGVVYVFLAAKNRPSCWLFGIASTAVLAYLTVTKYSLYADGLLNVFYAVMGFIGLYKWRTGNTGAEPQITTLDRRELFAYLLSGLCVAILSSELLDKYTSALSTTLDSFTTVFSIIATIWLIRRKIENWILWIVVDSVYVYLYMTRGAVLYALLMIIYTLIAYSGYRNWKRLYDQTC